ncbi:MAG: aminotransferase class IV [Planctomycetes bacterium]|nr:aminotransferase class IV [Planctomycetota bacterium]
MTRMPPTGLLETMRVVAGEGGVPRVPLLELHLARLADSARALGLPLPALLDLRARVAAAVAELRHDAVLRLAVNVHDGEPSIECAVRDLRAPDAMLRLLLVPSLAYAPSPTHKLLDRTHWDRLESRARAAGCDEPLLVRRDGTLGETSRGNLFLLCADRFVTPPDDGRILLGIARRVVLAGLRAHGANVVEDIVTIDDFVRATAVWSTNAAQGPRPVRVAADAPWTALPRAIWAAALAGGAAPDPA